MNPMSRHATLALGVLLLAAVAAPASGITPADFPTGEIASLQIFDRNPASGIETLVFQTSDPERIETLAAVVRGGIPGRDHKCANTGAIVFHMKGGGAVELGTLAGHDESWWEFRLYSGEVYRLFRVERGAFLGVLEQFGVRTKG